MVRIDWYYVLVQQGSPYRACDGLRPDRLFVLRTAKLRERTCLLTDKPKLSSMAASTMRASTAKKTIMGVTVPAWVSSR